MKLRDVLTQWIELVKDHEVEIHKTIIAIPHLLEIQDYDVEKHGHHLTIKNKILVHYSKDSFALSDMDVTMNFVFILICDNGEVLSHYTPRQRINPEFMDLLGCTPESHEDHTYIILPLCYKKCEVCHKYAVPGAEICTIME